MEIKGTIIAALPEVSGVSSRSGNPWKKREYVLENTEGNFPRKVAFTCFGENADKIQLQVGQAVTMYFDVESREYNGRWYTDIRAFASSPLDQGAAQQAAPAFGGEPAPGYGQPASGIASGHDSSNFGSSESDDLPF